MDRSLDILIVDDEIIVHDTLGEYLRECGHSIYNCHDGSVALTELQKRAFDLALIDVRMPGMSGAELLEEIQSLHPGMPVVMVTGHGNVDMAEQMQELGALAFLIKPVRLLELDDIVTRVSDDAACLQEESPE